MNIILLNPLTDPRYRVFIEQDSRATVFHTPEWIKVLADTYRFKPMCYATFENGTLTGVVPFCETRSITGKKRLVSLPFSDFCEPLLGSKEDLMAIFAKIQKGVNTYTNIDIRGGGSLIGGEQPGHTILTHDIDCNLSESMLWFALRPSLQRNIKKAERLGLTFSREDTIEAMQNFFKMNCSTRKEHGLPPQPWGFFENIWKNFIQQKCGFIATVRLNGKLVASSLFLLFGRKAFYKFGASCKKYLHYRPNDYIIWKSLLYCKEVGCASLNLGRTETQHEGLLQFKRGWGSVEWVISYFRFSLQLNQFETMSGSFINKVYPLLFMRMPIALLKPLGSFVHQFAG